MTFVHAVSVPFLAFCQTAGQWPQVDSLVPGGSYIITTTADVDAAVITAAPLANPSASFEITCVDHQSGQLFGWPPDAPPGKYRLTATLYGDCAARIPAWIAVGE